MLADGGFNLEDVDSGSIFKERFLAGNPSATYRPEITPTIGFIEFGRCITTERCRSIVLLGVIVLSASEESLDIIFCGIGTGAVLVVRSGIHFKNLRRVYTLSLSVEIGIFIVIPFVTSNHIDVKVSELVDIVKTLYVVRPERGVGFLTKLPVYTDLRTIQSVVIVSIAIQAPDNGRNEVGRKMLSNGEICGKVAVQLINVVTVQVVPVVAKRVTSL